MKRIAALGIAFLCATTMGFGQARKFALIEHFTNTSCGPCAAQNPGFEANVLQPNEATVRHISYHPWWPSNKDPFFVYDTLTQATRTRYYGVSGVPDAFLNGNKKHASPSGFSQADIDAVNRETSPIEVRVTSKDNGNDRTVTVSVKTVGDKPAGNFVLHTIMIETEVNTPAQANGETHFPHVFRKMFPDVSGKAITLGAQGETVTEVYTYTEDANLQLDKLEFIAFVQNTSTKEVLNTGSTFDPSASLMIPSSSYIQKGTSGAVTEFLGNIGNHNTVAENFKVELTSEAPSGWTAYLVIGGTNSGNSGTLQMQGGAVAPVSVKATPNNKAGIGKYIIKVTSIDNPNAPPIYNTVYVISGVTTLVVHNSALAGNFQTSSWKDIFEDGIQMANSMNIAHSDESFFANANAMSLLQDVKNVYFNVGWSFPAITPELAKQFQGFLAKGGNLFVGGQDVAWAACDPDPNNTYQSAEACNFLSAQMGVMYLSDGAAADSKAIASTGELFAGNADQTLVDFYKSGSTSYFFPDNLQAVGLGRPVLVYQKNNANKVAGVRMQTATSRTMYIAPGFEMFSDVNVRKTMVSLIEKWFNGLISGVEFDEQMNDVSAKSYPNPANSFAMIPVLSSVNTQILVLSDALGKELIRAEIPANTTEFRLNTAGLTEGTYFYSTINGDKKTSAKILQVAR